MKITAANSGRADSRQQIQDFFRRLRAQAAQVNFFLEIGEGDKPELYDEREELNRCWPRKDWRQFRSTLWETREPIIVSRRLEVGPPSSIIVKGSAVPHWNPTRRVNRVPVRAEGNWWLAAYNVHLAAGAHNGERPPGAKEALLRSWDLTVAVLRREIKVDVNAGMPVVLNIDPNDNRGFDVHRYVHQDARVLYEHGPNLIVGVGMKTVGDPRLTPGFESIHPGVTLQLRKENRQ